MIIVPVKEGDNIERALKKFKRKYEKTGIVKELRARQAFEKPSVANRKKNDACGICTKIATSRGVIFTFFLAELHFCIKFVAKTI